MKTHCLNGHAFTPENTYRASNGAKHCRTCKRERERRNHHLRSLGQTPPHNNGSVTDETLRHRLAVSGNERMLIALYRYGARHGGLPNIAQADCESWLHDARRVLPWV